MTQQGAHSSPSPASAEQSGDATAAPSRAESPDVTEVQSVIDQAAGRVESIGASTTTASIDSLDDEINKILKATGLSGNAASTPAQAQPVAIPQLSELDLSIAEDLDNLLKGDFQSVDDVLSGVFEEPAAGMPDSHASQSVAGSSPAQHSDTVATASIDKVAAVEPAATVVPRTSQPSSDAPIASAGASTSERAGSISAEVLPENTVASASPIPGTLEPASASAHNPQASGFASPAPAEAPTSGTMSAATETVQPPSAVQSIASPPGHADALPQAGVNAQTGGSAPTPLAPLVSASGPARAEQHTQAPSAPSRVPFKVIGIAITRKATGKIGGLGRKLLLGVSLPLRFVPASKRALVNLVALSLVAWTPIVWVFAIYMAPAWREARAQAAVTAAHEAAHESSDSHGESGSKTDDHGDKSSSGGDHGSAGHGSSGGAKKGAAHGKSSASGTKAKSTKSGGHGGGH